MGLSKARRSSPARWLDDRRLGKTATTAAATADMDSGGKDSVPA
jgi:hypothetical protein